MASEKRYDFFISYRRNCLADELAERLALMARAMQLNVYYDHEEIRDGHFDEKLKKGIAESRYFLLVISEGSLSRCANPGDWVAEEIKCALDNDIPIKVVTYEGQRPQWPDSLPAWMATLRTCHIESLPSYHHNLQGAFYRLICDSMPEIEVREKSSNDSDAISIIFGLAMLAGLGWLLWLLAKWCWNNIGLVGHWTWLIVKWPLCFVGILLGVCFAWEQLKAMFKGNGLAWLLFVSEIVAYFIFFY